MPLAFPTAGMGDQWISSIPMSGLSFSSPPSGGAAWPSANRALYIPVYLDSDGVVTKFWTFNGATASGNLDIGLYDAAGNRIASTGSVAQAGTSQCQVVDVTDFYVPAGWYYLARAHSNNTGTAWRNAPGIGVMRLSGIVQQATAFALPSSITPAALTSNYWPLYGLTYRTV